MKVKTGRKTYGGGDKRNISPKRGKKNPTKSKICFEYFTFFLQAKGGNDVDQNWDFWS